MESKSFEEWMQEVDRYLISFCTLDSSDLADYAYRGAYEIGELPRQAALEVLEENGW